MTTFPPAIATRLASTIKAHASKLSLHTQQITTLQTATAAVTTTANGTTTAIGTLQADLPTNYAFLATLSAQHPAAKAVTSGLSYSPPTGDPTGAELVAYMSNTGEFPMAAIITYINELAGWLNDLYDALDAANIID